MHFVNSPQLSFDAKIEGMYFLYSFLDTDESTHNGFHSDRISFIFSSTFVILFMYFTVIPLTGCLPVGAWQGNGMVLLDGFICWCGQLVLLFVQTYSTVVFHEDFKHLPTVFFLYGLPKICYGRCISGPDQTFVAERGIPFKV